MDRVNKGQSIKTRIEAWLHRQQPTTAMVDIPEVGVACGITIGQIRKENQDRMIIARLSNISGLSPTTIFAVCDGMGGMANGGECAEKTLAVLLDAFVHSSLLNVEDRLRASIMEANQEVFRQYRQRGGATVALICHSVNKLIAATVGDTRVYSLTPDLILKQVSVDDTIAGELNRRKGFSTENPQLEPFANQLAQFIGIGPELELRIYDLPSRRDISYYIASDGAYNIGAAFEHILINAPSPLTAIKRIISTSLWIGGKDNATIICISLDQKVDRFESGEPILEFWNASGKFELIPWHFLHVPERQSMTQTYKRGPINKTLVDRSRKTAKARDKSKNKHAEPKNTKPIRPMLEIDFRTSQQDSAVEDPNSQAEYTSKESRPTTIESEGEINEPNRGNVQDS